MDNENMGETAGNPQVTSRDIKKKKRKKTDKTGPAPGNELFRKFSNSNECTIRIPDKLPAGGTCRSARRFSRGAYEIVEGDAY